MVNPYRKHDIVEILKYLGALGDLAVRLKSNFPTQILITKAMDFITLLGLCAATLTTAAFLPQMLKTWQRKSAQDVSYVMLITFITGLFLWLIYGIILKSAPIILANSFTLFFNFIILWLKIKYR